MAINSLNEASFKEENAVRIYPPACHNLPKY